MNGDVSGRRDYRRILKRIAATIFLLAIHGRAVNALSSLVRQERSLLPAHEEAYGKCRRIVSATMTIPPSAFPIPLEAFSMGRHS